MQLTMREKSCTILPDLPGVYIPPKRELSLEENKPLLNPYPVVAIGILAASSSSILVRLAQQNAPSLVIAAYRMLLSSLLLWLYILVTRNTDLRKVDRSSRNKAILSGFLLSLHFATWITSLEYTTITSSVVLVTTSPLFVAALSPLLLRERIRGSTVFGLLLAFSGAAMIAAADGGSVLSDLGSFHPGSLTRQAVLGDLLALAGAAAGAGYILVGRDLRKHVPLLPYVTVSYSTAALVLLAVALVLGHPLVTYPRQTFLWFALLAIIPQLVAHTSLNWALRFLPAAFVSISLLGEPIGTSILAYVIFRESPARLTLLGAGLIFMGILLSSRPAHDKGQSDSPVKP